MDDKFEFYSRANKFFHQLSDKELLGLAGFYGVHSYSDVKNGKAEYFIDKENYPSFIIITIESNLIQHCRRILFINDMIILNGYLRSKRVVERTGLLCLISQ